MTIVSQVEIQIPQVELRRDRKANLPQGRGNCQGALPSNAGAVRVTELPMGSDMDRARVAGQRALAIARPWGRLV